MIVFVWYMYVSWTLDVIPDLIGHCYFTIYLLYSCHFLFWYIYFLYLLTFYMYMLFSVYSYIFTRSSDSLDLHIQICGYLLWSGIWRGLHVLRGAGASIFLIIGILPLLFTLFPDSIYIVSSCPFFLLFICYHCVRYLYVILRLY